MSSIGKNLTDKLHARGFDCGNLTNETAQNIAQASGYTNLDDVAEVVVGRKNPKN
jgi:hypothetical protein